MKALDTNTAAAESFWRRWARRCAIYAEALDISPEEDRNRRISALETEVASLRRRLSDRR